MSGDYGINGLTKPTPPLLPLPPPSPPPAMVDLFGASKYENPFRSILMNSMVSFLLLPLMFSKKGLFVVWIEEKTMSMYVYIILIVVVFVAVVAVQVM